MNLEKACCYRPVVQEEGLNQRLVGFALNDQEWIRIGGTGSLMRWLGGGGVAIRKDPASLMDVRWEMPDAHALIECFSDQTRSQTQAYLNSRGLQEQKPFRRP